MLVDILYKKNSNVPHKVSYKGKVYRHEWVARDEIRIHCNLEEAKNIINDNIQEIISIEISGSEVEKNNVVSWFKLSCKENDVYLEAVCDIPSELWESKWSPKRLLDSIEINELELSYIDIKEIDSYQEPYYVIFEKIVKKEKNIDQLVYDFSLEVNKFIKQCEIDLEGFRWNSKYEKDEELFCKDVLSHLLRKMDFLDVRYTHGFKEYGKDFTFSELTKFGDLRYYGLQAKAGNISGGVKSDIDEIIGQVEDAFAMPYYELGVKSPRYISTLIIAISGYFTENAREKIIQKIPNGIIGSIYFIDKEKIMGLVEQFWLIR